MASHRVATSASLGSHRHPDPVAGGQGQGFRVAGGARAPGRVATGRCGQGGAQDFQQYRAARSYQKGPWDRVAGAFTDVGIESSPESGASLGGGARVHLMRRWPDERVGEPAEQQS
jgi:hypothetical protein